MVYENSPENTGSKYSEMLMQLVKEFDKELPEELTFEETLEVGIDAWNLANNKEFLVSQDLYEKELGGYKDHNVIEKMVNFKIEKFPKSNNVIIDHSTKNNILQVKSQTQKNHFDSFMSRMVNYNPKKD